MYTKQMCVHVLLSMCNSLVFCLFSLAIVECSTEMDIRAPSSEDQSRQQPVCYLEEEEEIYITEPMQEITDGIFVLYVLHIIVRPYMIN